MCLELNLSFGVIKKFFFFQAEDGIRDVRYKDGVGATHVIYAILPRCQGSSLWCQEQLCNAGVIASLARYVGVVPIEVELAARPGWLQRRELHVLPFEASLKGVLAVDLGQ